MSAGQGEQLRHMPGDGPPVRRATSSATGLGRLRPMPALLPTFVVPIWKDLDHD